MNNGLRLAVSIPALLFASAASTASAQPSAQPAPDGSTVVVVTPPAPVVYGPAQGAPQGMPPGAAEMPPGAPAPAEPAPQNEQWSNVSHINGQLVPVGERGTYLYKWKTTNISSNPIGWMTGFYGLSVAHAIGQHAVIRGDGNLFTSLDSDDDSGGYEFGLTVPLYFKRVYQGPFFEPGIMVRDLNTSDGMGAFIGPQVNFGWHWTFDSGFNVAAAVGVARRIGQPSMSGVTSDDGYYSDGDYYSKVEPTGYFRVGYAY